MDTYLIEPYEISIWEDDLITAQNNTTYYKEKKVMVIGSNEMSSLNKVYNPVLIENMNGEKTLTFQLRYKYFDPISEGMIINPFANYLINERKVKLYYHNKWYDFIIKNCTESSDGLEWSYKCVDAFVLELSKNGYNIEFNAELNNNQGTAIELAEETLKYTDWVVDTSGSEIGKQTIVEPIYNAVFYWPANVELNITPIAEDQTPEDITNYLGIQTNIYVFYSYVNNQDSNNIQFILQKDSQEYVIDDNKNIISPNYRIENTLEYSEDENNIYFQLIINEEGTEETYNIITITKENSIETEHQAYRYMYSQWTTYDPVMERTVSIYNVTIDDKEEEIYEYKDYVYSTSDLITSYVTNGENFETFDNGEPQGWDAEVYKNSDKALAQIRVGTYPQIGLDSTFASIANYAEVEGFLQVKFGGRLDVSDYYANCIYNSGIEDNLSLINSISKGQEYVFRYRCGRTIDSSQHSELEQTSNAYLGLIVAKYNTVTRTIDGEKHYLKRIDPNGIILRFNQSGIQLNNIIDTGIFRENSSGQKIAYIIDDVVETPSTKYVYKTQNDSTEYIWDKKAKLYVPKTANNFLNYYYSVAKAEKSVSNSVLSDPSSHIGIFIFLRPGATPSSGLSVARWYSIEDIQLTKYIADKDNKPISIGNVPKAQSIETSYYYLKPKENAKSEEINTYTTLTALADSLGTREDQILPKYNSDSEKISSISEAQSNCFNILQSIAETFEVWLDLEVEHDESGAVRLDGTHKPIKKVKFKRFAGNPNYAGFKYGLNLNSIERTIESGEIVTKLIVSPTQSEYTDNGMVSIQYADDNPTGESYILNFDYYANKGLISSNYKTDILDFNKTISQVNKELNELQTDKEAQEKALVQLQSRRNVFTELVDTAKDFANDALSDFESATGRSYNSVAGQDVSISKVQYVKATETSVKSGTTYYKYADGKYKSVTPAANDNPKAKKWYVKLTIDDYDELIDIVSTLYSNYTVINNYSGLLTNINIEYNNVRKRLYGIEDYYFIVSVFSNEEASKKIKIYLSEYLTNFGFTYAGTVQNSSLGIKEWEIDYDNNYNTITNLIVPEGYQILDANQQIVNTITIDEYSTKKYQIKYNGQTTVKGLNQLIKEKIEEKNNVLRDFYNKYSRFIQEGTWSSTEYIDSNLYYLDALQVSNTSAFPKVSYNINVVEVSQLDGLENYKFSVGDKTWVEDEEFFGWHYDNVGTDGNVLLVKRPAREEVIVSEVEWYLDQPDQNTITVQNYKTQFEDLFQRLSATVQTVQYNEATYAKTSSIIDANGTLNQDLLFKALNNTGGRMYSLTSDGSILVTGDSILVQNLTNPVNRVIINSEGIRISNDGGISWKTAISGRGINIGTVYTGSLDTDSIYIGGKENPSFRWDKYGISAFETSDIPTTTYVQCNETEIEPEPDTIYYKYTDVFTAISNDSIEADDNPAANNWYKFDQETQEYVLCDEETPQIDDGTSEYITYYEKSIDYVQVYPVDNEESNEEVSPFLNGWFRTEEQFGTYNLNTYVRFDKYGLYGVNNGATFKATSLEDIENNAHFGITWHGFFIKNSYTNGRVEITSDNDFRVIQTLEDGNNQPQDHERIKIGALEFDGLGNPIKYGININQTVYDSELEQYVDIPAFTTGSDGNITITGTIYANAGEIGGMTVNNDRLIMDKIVLEPGTGIYALDSNDNYQFIISDVNGAATFNNINARGHIEAQTGTLGQLDITDTITVDLNGAIESSDWSAQQHTGWHIDNNGATFNNANIRGTIYANAGEIGGMSVDNTKLRMDHIVLEPGTGIYSDWGNTSINPFIISDEDGSAIFNNVTVRGSIKTSVFEYEEIQAVGGAFMFRPSTAIKTAVEDDGDLVLTVEKPLILRDGAWYKLSNYNSDDTIDADELTTYGLTHIYQLSKTKIENETEIRLIGGAAILQTINIDDIPGGSIIDMGFEPNTYRPMSLIEESSPVALHLYELVNDEYVLTTDIEVVSGKTYYKEWYQQGINNYGIGINSSDNYINLPPRAISLFETLVDHEQDPKVSYKYRGILGTLPQMRYSGNNPQVNQLYHSYLEGTQGIYTDNMYLGDHDQYITFYEDENGKKQLRIRANQIMFEIPDPEPDQDPWQDIADFDPEGTPGPAGQDAIRVAIESNVGNEFILSQEVATLTCTVYRGAEDVTSQVTKFLWVKNQANGSPDTTWNTAHEDYNLPYIEVTPSEINKKAIFGCRVTLPEE